MSLIFLGLNDNQLVGTLRESFGELKAIQKLFLFNNLFIGSIPDSFGQMNSLQDLDLTSIGLNGTIFIATKFVDEITLCFGD